MFIKEEERGPVAYVMGAVISKLYKKSAYGHSTSIWKEQIESLNTETLCVPFGENSYLSILIEGTFGTPQNEKIEMKFHVGVQKNAKTIRIEEIINNVQSDSTFVSFFDSIISIIKVQRLTKSMHVFVYIILLKCMLRLKCTISFY